MPAYILTGAPGSGKTAVLRLLETIGYVVVEEAATDVIALGHALGCEEPWLNPGFIDEVVALQRRRQEAARAAAGGAVFFDRSPACTLALSRFLGLAPSRLLAREVDRLVAEGTYEATAFFIRNQGFIQATAARRISFEDSLAFEQLHEQVYRELGFRLIDVPAGPLADRIALIQQAMNHVALGMDRHGGAIGEDPEAFADALRGMPGCEPGLIPIDGGRRRRHP
jgi:predicted ATPase